MCISDEFYDLVLMRQDAVAGQQLDMIYMTS